MTFGCSVENELLDVLATLPKIVQGLALMRDDIVRTRTEFQALANRVDEVSRSAQTSVGEMQGSVSDMRAEIRKLNERVQTLADEVLQLKQNL
jgi:hypothetical protein